MNIRNLTSTLIYFANPARSRKNEDRSIWVLNIKAYFILNFFTLEKSG